MSKLVKETGFFTLYWLDDGVYAAIAKPNQGAWSNAGIIDLGDETLVFDSFTTPSAGYELRKQAEIITGNKVKYLINSHYHGDHVFGNQAFEDIDIISTSITKNLSEKENRIEDLEQEKGEMKAYLINLQKQIDSTHDRIVKDSLINQLNEMTKILDELHKFIIVLPNMIFEDKMVIKGSKRKVELYCFGGGHTQSDTLMYLPEEKVAFMGDIITEGVHLPIYNPDQFRSILANVSQMDIQFFVPGHGNIGDRELFNTFSNYISFLIQESRQAIEHNLSLELFVSKCDPPKEYREWLGTNGINGNLTKVFNFYANTEYECK